MTAPLSREEVASTADKAQMFLMHCQALMEWNTLHETASPASDSDEWHGRVQFDAALRALDGMTLLAPNQLKGTVLREMSFYPSEDMLLAVKSQARRVLQCLTVGKSCG